VVAACGGGSTAPADATPPVVTPPTPNPPVNEGTRVVGNTLEVTLARVPALTAATGSLTHGPTNTFIVNLGQAVYRAFSNICPHASCGVSGFDGRAMICPCHGSEFNPTTGARTAGPATTGLTPRPVTLDSAAGILRVQIA
jgi:nitrite reductase/ring-hydroxylating ferredoxin subunit